MRCCQIFAPMPKMAKPKTTIMSTVIQFAGVQDKIVVSAIVTSNKNSAPSLAHRRGYRLRPLPSAGGHLAVLLEDLGGDGRTSAVGPAWHGAPEARSGLKGAGEHRRVDLVDVSLEPVR